MENDQNIHSLPESIVKEISSRYIHGVDKFSRMYAGMASSLERYEDGIIYLKIENTQKTKPSNYDTALGFARNWANFNKELAVAKGFVVLFYETKSTGFAVKGSDVVGNKDLVTHIVQQFNSALKEEKVLVSIYSGLFAEDK